MPSLDDSDRPQQMTVGQYLIARLQNIGCQHVFGVPGDFVLGLLKEVTESSLQYIGTCNELNAAYAADGYARLKGIGCVITTFSVGELSAINGVAGSYAECVPVLHIAGIPPRAAVKEHPLLHHSLGDFTIAAKMYSHVTVAQTMLLHRETARFDIDSVIAACLLRQRPGYIAIPSDMVHQVIDVSDMGTGALKGIPGRLSATLPSSYWQEKHRSYKSTLEEAVGETLRRLEESSRPLFIAGSELRRRSLLSDFEALLERSKIPFVTMIEGKGIIHEAHPQFIGLYSGANSREYVRNRVNGSDCLIIWGEQLTDFNTGSFTSRFNRRHTIEVNYDHIQIGFHRYSHVYIHDFLRALQDRVSTKDPSMLDITPASQSCTHRIKDKGFSPQNDAPLSCARFFERLAYVLPPNSIVIAETGLSLFASVEVMMPYKTTFISQAFFGSIGYTMGATLGAAIAAPDRPVFTLIGDGSFQVTCQDLSTLIRHMCNVTMFLINNDGYTIERMILDGSFNDIQPWKYHQLPAVMGGDPKRSFNVYTEGDLEQALQQQNTTTSAVTFIELHIDRMDVSASLKKAGKNMALKNKLLKDAPDEDARNTAYDSDDPKTPS